MSVSRPGSSLNEIATLLGVSSATVSNALAGKGRVSAELAEKIRATAASLGYTPSMTGRALRTGRTQVLGLVLPNIANPLFPQIAQAIEQAAAKAGYGVLIADSHGDIAAQTAAINRLIERSVDGIVVVPRRGTRVADMGEPLLNFDPTVTALRLMLDDNAYGLSRRRVTLSTSGVVPMIDKLSQECPVALAVSLHASNDALRDSLIPLNRKHPLRELMLACKRYLEFAPRDFITFEYCMLDGVNDTDTHARELVALVKEGETAIPCKFNLIPFNPFPESGLKRSHNPRIKAFAQILMDAGIVTTIRKTRGDDIDAACGQLAGEVKDRTRVQERMQKMAEYQAKFGKDFGRIVEISG